jgi:hypothetical protein
MRGDEPTLRLHENAAFELGDLTGQINGVPTSFAPITALAPFRRFKKAAKTISAFTTVANSVITAGANNADTNLSTSAGGANEVYPTNGMTAQFGALTAVTSTFTIGTTVSYMSNLNAINMPIDVSGCSIHTTLHILSGTVTNVYVDLFSSGSPAAVDANYHTADLSSIGMSTSRYGFGAIAVGLNRFTAVGTGATLTAITYARIRVVGQTGAVVRPCEIAAVKNAATKASVVFTFDDGHSDPLTYGFKLLGPYGFPGVLFPSSNAGGTGNTSGTYGSLTPDQMIALQLRHGWQIGAQEYRYEPQRDMTAREWLEEQQKNIIMAAAMGFDTDGIRDGSYYGGGPYYITQEQYYVAHRIHASMRQFYNGIGSLGDGLAPFYDCDTNPPGDPHLMKSLNYLAYGSGAGAANNIYLKYKAYVDQAIANKGIAIFAGHNDWINTEIFSAMQLLCAYLKTKQASGEVQVVTLKELRRQSELVTW